MNKVLHEAKRHKGVNVVIQPIPLKSFRFLAFSDASFSSRKKPDSHSGSIILGTRESIDQTQSCPISPISWGCRKFRRWSPVHCQQKRCACQQYTRPGLLVTTLWLCKPSGSWKRAEDTLKKQRRSYNRLQISV